MSGDTAILLAAFMGALAYGIGDFLGGRAATRISTCLAVAIAQSTSLLFMMQHFARNEAQLPGGDTLLVSQLAGIAYACALLCLYSGFARGRIGIVAPLCGLMSILIPVAGDTAIHGLPTDMALLGVALCVAAVLLISSVRDAGTAPLGFSIRMGLMSGAGYGAADLLLGLLPADEAGGALLVTRAVTAAVALAALVVVTYMLPRPAASGRTTPGRARSPATPPWRGRIAIGCGIAMLAGAFDILGHAGYVVSATSGNITTAAALVSLFPAVSVLLAVVFLRERTTHRQHAGFVAAFVGAGLLSG